jgi:uncharacterized protein
VTTVPPAMSSPVAISFPGTTPRADYAYPFRVDAVTGPNITAAGEAGYPVRRTSQSPYAAHVQQMVYQLLMTNPGERVNQPQFGCGLRGMVFGPLNDALAATVQLRVLQALTTWLNGVVAPGQVAVTSSADNSFLEPGTIVVSVSYTLVETQTTDNVTVTVL